MRALCIVALGLVACSSPTTLPDTDAGAGEASKGDACASMLWPDTDGDGFGDKLAQPTLGCPHAGVSTNALDCGDGDPLMHPGQTKAQRGPAKGKTSGSAFDYDCDGATTVTNGNATGSCTGSCSLSQGWTIPEGGSIACASMYDWVASCTQQCSPNIESRYPDCL